MNQVKNFFISRKDIAIRLLYTIFFLIAFEFLKTLQYLLVSVQYLWLLITKKHLESLRNFSDRLAVLSYRMLRYLSLNENKRPFPFADFPEALDPADPLRFNNKE